eukprot:TRINITY_DN43123_c0_g1_i1.p1 TRINITY_DN43123_c0_g1~~TRINITY_DN43123_c0_g1_i1.p1  ORF type:complete len:749 (+),score=210.85 TRINITY_DN43123_c0_g1_i1:42-2288(+)
MSEHSARQVSFSVADLVEDAGETDDDEEDSDVQEDAVSPRAIVSSNEAVAADVPFFDLNQLHDDLRITFSDLLQERDGGTAVYWFEGVHKCGTRSVVPRILIVGDSAVYLADPRTAGITRWVHVAHIEACVTEQGSNYMAFTIPTAHDMLLSMESTASVAPILSTLNKLRAQQQLPPIRHVALQNGQTCKDVLNLAQRAQRPPSIVKLQRQPTRRGDSFRVRRGLVPGVPNTKSLQSLNEARHTWKAGCRSTATEETLQYVSGLEARCADLEGELAELQESTSMEIVQLGQEVEISENSAAELQKRNGALKARERQLETDVKRLSEANDELNGQLREVSDNTTALKQRVNIMEKENAALLKERTRVCEILIGDSVPEDPAEYSTTTTSITEAIRQALSTTESLQDDNWRLVKQVAELQKKLGNASRLKKDPPLSARGGASSPQSVPDSRLDLIDALESERDALKMTLHKAQRAHEVTKLKLFDQEHKHSALVTKHADVTQAQRNTIRCLERKVGRLELNIPPEAGFTLKDPPDAGRCNAHTPNANIGNRVSVSLRGQVTTGVVKYKGLTGFAPGVWVGVALDEPLGRHNGTVHDNVYFRCAENCGAFVRDDALAVEAVHCVRCVEKEGGQAARTPRTDFSTTSRARSQSAVPAPDAYLQVALDLRQQLDTANKKLAAEEETTNYLRASLAKASPVATRSSKTSVKDAVEPVPANSVTPTKSPPLPPPSLSRLSPTPPQYPLDAAFDAC